MNETLPATDAPVTRDQHILGLAMSNCMAIRVVNLDFSKDPIGVKKISGPNDVGKTSLIQGIVTQMTGEKPDRILRDGTEEGEVVTTTEDYTIRYAFTKRGEYLTVKANANPKKALAKPRELLEAMFKGFVDPLEFADRMDNDKRRDFLLKVCPVEIDLSANAAETVRLFGERTIKNRDVTRLEGQQKGFTGNIPTVRPVPVDTTAVMAERGRREESNRKRDQLVEDGKTARKTLDDANTNVTAMAASLKTAEDAVVAAKSALKAAQDAATTAQANFQTAKDTFSAAPAVETFADLDAQINSAAQVATDIATFDQYEKVAKELRTARTESQTLTDKIEASRKAREDALKKAEFPVEGLGIDTEGLVTFNGLPFSQTCQSKRLRIAVALLAAANPQLKWLAVKDGSGLDSKSMMALDELCRAYNIGAFVEVVESTDPAAIQISDGTVVAS